MTNGQGSGSAARVPIARQSPRVSFPAELELRQSGHKRYQITVRDCSPQGCCLNLVDRLSLDEVVWIKMPGLESLEAYVCWTRDFLAGVEFTKPLHPAVFDMLLKRFPPAKS